MMKMSTVRHLVLVGYMLVNVPVLCLGNLDSLFSVLSQKSESQDLIMAINQQIKAIVYTQPARALYFSNKLDSLSNDIYSSETQAEIKYTLGQSLYVNEEYDKALSSLLTALAIFEENGKKSREAEVLNSLATVYQVRNDTQTAVKYFSKALEIFEQLNDSTWIASVCANLGGHYMEFEEEDAAETHFERAIHLFEHLGNSIYLGFTQLNLGSLRVKQQRHEEAISLFESAISYVPFNVNPLIHAVAHTGLGQSYLETNQLNKARLSLLKGYEITEQINHLEQRKSVAELLGRYYEAVSNYKRAFVFQKEYSTLQDSFLNAEQDQRMVDALNKFEAEKKEKEISLLSAENEIKDLRIQRGNRNLLITLLTLLAISLFAFQVVRSRRKMKKLNHQLTQQRDIIAKALEEKDVLLREIHHRVKNNLQVISSLLGIQARQVTDNAALEALQEGRTRVQSMSLIHQDLYKKDNLTGIEIKDYFEKLAQNLFDTYNISSQNITIHSSIEELILDVDTVIPLGLIMNELISNALKYAFPDNRGEIKVSLKEIDDQLQLVVSDNGIGISDPEHVLENDSYGYDLITSLVDKLEGNLEINVGKGTQIKATFKEFRKAA